MKSNGNGQDMNRNEAVKTVGLENVDAVEREIFEYSDEQNGLQHWTAYQICPGKGIDGCDVTITAHYYMGDDKFIGADGELVEDLGNLDWEIDHYSAQE